ncbi:MAG TPA: hypothetical protein VN725_00755 [Rhodanobacteraceae bacterium]|nr:hypothetical protein [Rhodanobacteraceae bacterium]
MNTRIFRRSLIAAGLLLAGVVAAPAAFARSHVSIGLGFYGPGYSVGYNNCVNCYYPPAYPAYYSGYYAPAPAYYYDAAPVYYDPYPAYGTVYYGSAYYGGYYHHRWGDRDDWRGRDRDHRWHDHDHDHDGGWHH